MSFLELNNITKSFGAIQQTICSTSGVKMSCIARSILPPGITMTLGRDMKLLSIIDSR